MHRLANRGVGPGIKSNWTVVINDYGELSITWQKHRRLVYDDSRKLGFSFAKHLGPQKIRRILCQMKQMKQLG
ncbi:hypothetical protein D3P96_05075 [Weissella viridescens]|uniref:Uncharacterized protein n=1 Tax=Weissella viridescens TaxID=1629 RepID=A0A3P2RBW3_WEIVI|nr:hypothetical protein D3P96_05075 [Weissella viridescens]